MSNKNKNIQLQKVKQEVKIIFGKDVEIRKKKKKPKKKKKVISVKKPRMQFRGIVPPSLTNQVFPGYQPRFFTAMRDHSRNEKMFNDNMQRINEIEKRIKSKMTKDGDKQKVEVLKSKRDVNDKFFDAEGPPQRQSQAVRAVSGNEFFDAQGPPQIAPGNDFFDAEGPPQIAPQRQSQAERVESDESDLGLLFDEDNASVPRQPRSSPPKRPLAKPPTLTSVEDIREPTDRDIQPVQDIREPQPTDIQPVQDIRRRNIRPIAKAPPKKVTGDEFFDTEGPPQIAPGNEFFDAEGPRPGKRPLEPQGFEESKTPIEPTEYEKLKQQLFTSQEIRNTNTSNEKLVRLLSEYDVMLGIDRQKFEEFVNDEGELKPKKRSALQKFLLDQRQRVLAEARRR